jgi:hypothetical protein
MAMDGKAMAEEVLKLIHDEMGGENNPAREKVFRLLCTGIVKHIQQHAEVAGTEAAHVVTGTVS